LHRRAPRRRLWPNSLSLTSTPKNFDSELEVIVRGKIRVIVPFAIALVAAATFVSPVASATTPTAMKRATSKPTGEITVAAAASLTAAFGQITTQFEKKYPGTHVTVNADASSALVLQIQSGAPVDVFASADEANMTKLVDDGHVTAKPVDFAKNRLEIAVKPGNPLKITSLADLADAGVVALCAPEVPCGKYADAALAAAGVTIPADHITRAANATATLTAVSAGDADAAVVYVTDVNGAGKAVTGVKIPDAQNQIAIYPIAPLAAAPNSTTAKAFAKYVASPAGEKVLKKYGFLAP
jgi:molybdate transport system substrate-binding protein